MIGEAEGQSDFAHLLLVAVVTFTPVGIYDQMVCGRRACVSVCVGACVSILNGRRHKKEILGQLDTGACN